MKALILARVSTKEQEEGHSLDAQLMRLREYCSRKDLNVLKEFKLIESSTRGDRPEFYEMIEFIKNQPNKIALVCDKVDRLQRSFKELPVLEELRTSGKVELHFNAENQVLDENANSSQMMAYHMFVLMANNYTNCISDNVKRSNEKKLKEGTICGSAPLGYLNRTDDNGNKTVVFDPARALLVKKMFEDYATGLYSLKEIKIKATEGGLRSKKGLVLGNSAIEGILKNPFYYGVMKVKGKLYPHVYKTLIDEYLFMQCKKVRESRSNNYSKKTKTAFIFKGLIRCKKCNCLLSPEIKKSKYIYLRPNNKSGCGCSQINEKIALKAVTDALSSISIPECEIENIQEAIRNSLESKIAYSKISIKALRAQYDDLEAKQNRLLDILLSQSITQDEYDKKIKQLRSDQHNIKLSLTKHTTANEDFAITLEYLIKLASRAKQIFESSGTEQKRKIIKLVFSNLYLEGEDVTFSMNKPFNKLVNNAGNEKWLR